MSLNVKKRKHYLLFLTALSFHDTDPRIKISFPISKKAQAVESCWLRPVLEMAIGKKVNVIICKFLIVAQLALVGYHDYQARNKKDDFGKENVLH